MIIEIPITPRSKKNSQNIVINKKTNRLMVVQNKVYTQYEKDCKEYMPKLDKPIDYPINLKCNYYVGDARARDIVNFIEATQDILVKYKVLKDDNYNIVASLDGSSMQIDREKPHCIIEITKKEVN